MAKILGGFDCPLAFLVYDLVVLWAAIGCSAAFRLPTPPGFPAALLA